MKKHKEYKGKWKNLEVYNKERNNIYSKLRSKANTILKKRHKKEYLAILRGLNDDVFNEFKKKIHNIKGGLKNGIRINPAGSIQVNKR